MLLKQSWRTEIKLIHKKQESSCSLMTALGSPSADDGVCSTFSWEYFPHDHARLRAYRWGEDGLLGITDRQCRLCLSLGLWNGKDPILKERLYGLTGPQVKLPQVKITSSNKLNSTASIKMRMCLCYMK